MVNNPSKETKLGLHVSNSYLSHRIRTSASIEITVRSRQADPTPYMLTFIGNLYELRVSNEIVNSMTWQYIESCAVYTVCKITYRTDYPTDFTVSVQ